jgi:demethylmenaquinone methyltransferase/2-methoxy-6-polyprenyl-1,4-benzoquinol methylase
MCLDVCSGTGETAQLLNRYTEYDSFIIPLDFSLPMVSVGKKKRKMKKIHFVLGDAIHLPFQDNVFDVMTITFATRNISPKKEILEIHLREFFRVLKPGGLFVNLETSQPSYRILKIFFHLYVRLAVRSIGPLISKSNVGYKYLAHTVPRFLGPKELAELVRKAGFNEINFTPLFFGIAALHTAKK